MSTEAKLLAQIDDLKAQVAQSQAEHWKLVRLVCHELRLPLSSIKGYTDLLPLMGTLNDQQKDFVARVKKNVTRMSGMLSNLHDLAYLGEHTLKLKIEPVLASDCIADVCLELQPVAAEHGLALTKAAPADLPPVLADRERLAQCLRVLIENACWYTPAGGTVAVSAQPDTGAVEMAVRDTGIGVPEADRPSLFKLFFRGDIELVRQQPGAGMGLHMLSRLVELMGGAYGADFPPEGGSRFWLRLPSAVATPEPHV